MSADGPRYVESPEEWDDEDDAFEDEEYES